MHNYSENPKLVGTNIVDCIPQTGECPIQCPECYYNGGRFFRTLDEPWMPPSDTNKIVRVNSGNDSNIDRDMVIAKTIHYKHKFYNTSIPNFDFPAPVVFTCNGGKNSTLKLVKPDNVMFVRVKTTLWNVEDVDAAVNHYLKKYDCPVVLTFMRFYNGNLIPDAFKKDYEWRKSILNEYYCIKQDAILNVLNRYKGSGVRMCGTPVSSKCIDCRNCEYLYWKMFFGVEDGTRM